MAVTLINDKETVDENNMMNEKINELYFIQSSPHRYHVYKNSIEKRKKLLKI